MTCWRDTKNLGYSLLDLMVVIIASGLSICLLLNLYSKCLNMLYIQKNNYSKINELIVLENVMEQVAANVNFSPCLRLTDLGVPIDKLINTSHSDSQLNLQKMDENFFLIDEIHDKFVIINDNYQFDINDEVIIVSCDLAVFNKIINIIKYKDKLKLEFLYPLNTDIYSHNNFYIAKWQKISFKIADDLIYIDAGHKELWLSHLKKSKFYFDKNHNILHMSFVFDKNQKHEISWELH